MTSHIALLRGVNVGGNVLKMERLRAVLTDLGLADVKSYVQSGNVLFTATGPAAKLAQRIEAKLAGEARLPVSVIIRTPAQLGRIIEANPFLGEAGVDARTLHVTFLAGRAPRPGLAALGAVASGADRWRAAGAEIYLHCPGGYGRTKLNNTAIEKLLGVCATTRNWNTVRTLYEMSRQ
jgi:uncharacterized protein (DUF1697 family)